MLTVKKYARDFAEESLSEYNRRGIYEIAELYYSDEKQINKPILSFTNDRYTEVYGLRQDVSVQNAEDKVYELIRIYFDKSQLYRGV